MHISLTPELETMVKDRVESGMYHNASEVVREALRNFFHVSGEEAVSPQEAERIRQVVAPRLEAFNNGTAAVYDADQVFDEIEKKYFTE